MTTISFWLRRLQTRISGDAQFATDVRDAIEAVSEADLTSHTGNTSNPHSVTKTQVGLGNCDNTSDANKPVSTATQTALDLKAPLASPTFTGVPAGPTAALGTNTTQLATTAFVKAGLDNLVDSAPGALDTLNELAAALGDDANYAATMTTALAGKEPTQTVASQAEAEAGAETAIRSWSPLRIFQAIAKRKRSFCLVPFASDETVAVGDGTIGFCVPADMNGLNITAVTAAVKTAGATSGTTDVQIRRVRGAASADVLSTKVTLSVSEYSVSDGVVNASNDDLATGDLIFVDVDAVNGTAPSGLSVVVTAS